MFGGAISFPQMHIRGMQVFSLRVKKVAETPGQCVGGAREESF